MRKRLLSALLAMAMMLTMLPMSALADGETTAEWSYYALRNDGNQMTGKDDCTENTWGVKVANGKAAGYMAEMTVGDKKYSVLLSSTTASKAFTGAYFSLNTVPGQIDFIDETATTGDNNTLKTDLSAGKYTISLYEYTLKNGDNGGDGWPTQYPDKTLVGTATELELVDVTFKQDGKALTMTDSASNIGSTTKSSKLIAVGVPTPAAKATVDSGKTLKWQIGDDTTKVITPDADGNITLPESTTGTIVLNAVIEDETTDKEISEVAITLKTDGLKAGDALQNATVGADAHVTVATKWLNESDEEVTGTFPAAGTYKAEVTVTPADDYTLAAGAKYTLNTDVEKKALTNGKATISVTVAAADPDPSLPTVVPAPLEDHPATGDPIPAKDLGTVTATIAAGSGEKNYNVTVTGTDIVAHTNAVGNKGTWVGFGMPIEDGATYKYTLKGAQGEQDQELASVAARVYEKDGKKYNTMYFDTAGTYTIEQAKVEGQAATVVATYKVTVDITPKTVVPEKSTLSVTAAEGTLTDLGNKAVADLQGDLTIANPDKDNVIKVTGTSKYVTGWTQFSSNTTEQKGNYVALKLMSSKADEKVSINKNNNWVALDTDRILVVLLDGPSKSKVEVALGETDANTKAAYTIDLTGMTKQSETKPVDKVTALGIGFEAVGSDANAGIADLGGYVTDCEDNTMFVRFAGLTSDKHYKVMFTDSKNETVYDSLVQVGDTNHEITGTTTTTVYFTFTGNGSKPVTGKTLASGKYKATLYEKAENGTWTAVTGGVAEIELHKLTVKNGATTLSETYYQSTKTVDAPAALENTTTAAFKGWKKGSEIVTSVAMTADVTLEAVWETYVIDAETLTVEAANATLKAEIKTAADGKKTIAISGLAPDTTAKVTLKYQLDKTDADKATKEITVTFDQTKGVFSTTDKVTTTSGVEYAVDLAGVKVLNAAVVPADPQVTTGTGVKEDDKGAVETALKNSTADLSDVLAHDDNAESVSSKAAVTQKAAKAQLDAAKIETKDKTITVVVQPQVVVKAESYDKEAGTMKVDISAAYQVVATTVDDVQNDAIKTEGEGANAVVIASDKLTVDTSISVTVGLPDELQAKAVNGKISVLHEKKGNHYHEANVAGTAGNYAATFTSSDGLSPFTFDAAANLVAEVNGKSYTTLADAIKAAGNNDVIIILKALTGEAAKATVTVDADKKVTFKMAVGIADTTITVNDKAITVTAAGVEHEFKKPDSKPNQFPGGGGASGATTYSVNVPTTEHGTVTVNPRNASKDATVTITVSPNQGYILDTLTVTDKDGNNIELTKVDSNKYTFKMPASRVEIKASFKEGTAPANGGFTDITSGEYYYDAVLWAVDKGITTGLTETTFGPNASCTRAQMVTFLWRAAGSPEPAATTTAFTDIDSNEYYYKAVLWAVEKGITTGATETTFAPNATVTRAQTVTFLYRYAGKPAVSGSNGFTDLEAGEYYVDAVQWAATNGITTGTTETTFSPANNCTRGQIVTFLYRHIVK